MIVAYCLFTVASIAASMVVRDVVRGTTSASTIASALVSLTTEGTSMEGRVSPEDAMFILAAPFISMVVLQLIHTVCIYFSNPEVIPSKRNPTTGGYESDNSTRTSGEDEEDDDEAPSGSGGGGDDDPSILEFGIRRSSASPMTSHELSFSAPADGDVGYDIQSAEDVVLPKGEPTKVRTLLQFHAKVSSRIRDLGLEVHPLILDRSSMAAKGLKIAGGVIDPRYTGECSLVFHNNSGREYHIKAGDRVAQAIMNVVITPRVKECRFREAPSWSRRGTRGSAGFGSTGSNGRPKHK
jgi:dUTP pyrophosphatase